MSPVTVAHALRDWGLRRSDPWYHQTPMRCRLAIQRHGLIPRRPVEHNYADLAGEERIDAQPVGVYVTAQAQRALGLRGLPGRGARGMLRARAGAHR